MRPSSRRFSSSSRRLRRSRFGFVLALVGNFLDALFFFSRLVRGQGLVVFGDQALDLFAVNHEHFRGPRLNLLDVALAVEFVLLFALDVGVVAQALFVFERLSRPRGADSSRICSWETVPEASGFSSIGVGEGDADCPLDCVGGGVTGSWPEARPVKANAAIINPIVGRMR